MNAVSERFFVNAGRLDPCLPKLMACAQTFPVAEGLPGTFKDVCLHLQIKHFFYIMLNGYCCPPVTEAVGRRTAMAEKFSVLMSLYVKEKPEYLRQAMDSVLEQTAFPEQIVVVKDGPLTAELDAVLNEYVTKNPQLFTVVPLETNRGLGLALAEGMLHCRNELVARMDTDDIARNDRFELQLKEFEKDPELDVCGSHIVEFETDIHTIVAARKVPLTDAEIKAYQKRRDGMNHVAVMFKKSSVLKAGNYQSCMLMEDTLLWMNMIMTGAKFMNIDDDLVYVRIGQDMFERRGGFAYFLKYREGRKKVRETGYISSWDYYYTLLVQLVVALVPNKVRGFIFKKLLHR